MRQIEGRNPKPSALLRWTGSGRLDDLESSVRNTLAGRGFSVVRVGRTIGVVGGEPAMAARYCEFLPGVAWLGLGYSSGGGLEGILESLEIVGRRYLRENTRFMVDAEVTGEKSLRGDLRGAANSRLLGLRRGARIDERRPSLLFHVAIDDGLGVAGVEVKRGVGGVPTTTEKAYCLVSGGMHSSVVAWMAAVAGYSVELVHAQTSEESVVEAARLYSELSNRIDPSGIGLTLLTGSGNSSTAGVVAAWLGEGHKLVFAGHHVECRREKRSLETKPGITNPLLLLPEVEFARVYESLGLRGNFESSDLLLEVGESPSRYRVSRFGGARADLHDVLKSLRK